MIGGVERNVSTKVSHVRLSDVLPLIDIKGKCWQYDKPKKVHGYFPERRAMVSETGCIIQEESYTTKHAK